MGTNLWISCVYAWIWCMLCMYVYVRVRMCLCIFIYSFTCLFVYLFKDLLRDLRTHNTAMLFKLYYFLTSSELSTIYRKDMIKIYVLNIYAVHSNRAFASEKIFVNALTVSFMEIRHPSNVRRNWTTLMIREDRIRSHSC